MDRVGNGKGRVPQSRISSWTDIEVANVHAAIPPINRTPPEAED